MKCKHDGTELVEMPDDPLLPPHIEPLECPTCGEVYHRDTETGAVEVDA